MKNITGMLESTITYLSTRGESNPDIKEVKQQAYRRVPDYGLRDNWGRTAANAAIETLVEIMGPEVLQNPKLAAGGASLLADIYAADMLEYHYPGLEAKKISEIAGFYGLEPEELEGLYASVCAFKEPNNQNDWNLS